ncbi:MAG: Holliday junction resolvase RuvX [Chloroflexi bacterium]|nr:Holliday junction resolvase RuvX [Chloroflexota bacterium]
MRILAVDPGEARLGLALSDPAGVIASPLGVLTHLSRAVDAAAIAQSARENDAGLILVGQSLDAEGQPTPQARRAARLAAAIRAQTSTPVLLWDEYGSTQAARSARQALGASRSRRRGHLDELAATYILQTYLDAHAPQ